LHKITDYTRYNGVIAWLQFAEIQMSQWLQAFEKIVTLPH